MGTVFLDEAKATRADRLKIPDELLFSGRVWSAHEALDHGLIDQIAVLEDLKQGVFKDATIHDYKQERSFAEGISMEVAMRELVAEVLEPGSNEQPGCQLLISPTTGKNNEQQDQRQDPSA